MRLSDCLSKPISAKFEQSEGFLDNKKLKAEKNSSRAYYIKLFLQMLRFRDNFFF